MASSNTSYPLPGFHFKVEWKGKSVGFSEVSGLTQELQVIEYRHGDDKDFGLKKQPGIQKHSNITLSRGICEKDNDYFKWFNSVKMNKIERRDLTISLLNEKHEAVMVWKIQNAFPVKLDGPTMKSSGNEIAIEKMELAHEGCVIQNE